MKPPKVRSAHPAPEGTIPPPPLSISHSAFVEAVRPLLAAVGTDPDAIMVTGFQVTSEGVEFLTTEPLIGVDPVLCGEDEVSSIWVWPVRVEVALP